MCGQLSQGFYLQKTSSPRSTWQRQGSLGDSLRNCIQTQSSLPWDVSRKGEGGRLWSQEEQRVLTETAPQPGVHLLAVTASSVALGGSTDCCGSGRQSPGLHEHPCQLPLPSRPADLQRGQWISWEQTYHGASTEVAARTNYQVRTLHGCQKREAAS